MVESSNGACVCTRENDFPNLYLTSPGKRISFRKINVNQIYRLTLRNIISKLAPNWLINVKVIDLCVCWGGGGGGGLTGPFKCCLPELFTEDNFYLCFLIHSDRKEHKSHA